MIGDTFQFHDRFPVCSECGGRTLPMRVTNDGVATCWTCCDRRGERPEDGLGDLLDCAGRRLGDQGQRYEIKFQHRETLELVDIGWSESPDGFAEALRLDPQYRNTHERIVIDRKPPAEGHR